MHYGLKPEKATSMLLGPFDVDMSIDPAILSRTSDLGSFTESDEVMIHYTVTEEVPFIAGVVSMRLPQAGETQIGLPFFPDPEKGRIWKGTLLEWSI